MEARIGTRRWWRSLALGVGMAMFIAACSTPGTSQAPSTAPTTAASEAAPSAGASEAAPSAGASEAAPSASASGEALAEVCAAAVTEGKLVHWHNHSDNFSQVIDAFKAAYPGIEVEDLVLSPDEAAQRILTEIAAGRPPTPDLTATGLDVFKPLIDRGAAETDVDWAALGVPADVLHQDNFVRIHRIALGLGYNTDALTPDQLPNTWEELVDAKWAGRVIVDPRGRPFDTIGLAWGNEKTLDYVQRLKDIAQPLVIEGGTAGLVAVAGGEADITTGGRSAETLEQQAEGAPIGIKYLDVVSTIDNYNVPLKDAAHPNAAKCWIGWFSSEGQALYDEIEFKTNEAVPVDAPAGATIVTIETPEQADTVKDLGTEIGRIWTGG
ncbi:MAG TPA: ABC transporter substrate-binding protein [Candidatus Saccharimonadales bacterium]|nr:ABC transporter substrate-binding protein [Candidatus Saccharimonadales bacterium]